MLVAVAILTAACGGGAADDVTSGPPTSIECLDPTSEPVTAEPTSSDRGLDTSTPDAPDPRIELVVVGDSIVAENLDLIDQVLTDDGRSNVHYAALGARRIAETSDYLGERPSGLEAIDVCRDRGLMSATWVIELGTNDIPAISDSEDPAAAAGALIDAVLDELGQVESISWVTVLDRGLLDASRVFNDALQERAAARPELAIIDWYAAAVDHPEWFEDDVHPNELGATALAELVLAELERLDDARDP
jgi:lysophospholipase L1-like esterase